MRLPLYLKFITAFATLSFLLLVTTGVVWGKETTCVNGFKTIDGKTGLVPCSSGEGDKYIWGDFFKMLDNIYKKALVFATLIAVAILVINGVKMILSRGDEAKFTSAKNWITYTIIGILMIYLSWFIINYIINFFGYSDKDWTNPV